MTDNQGHSVELKKVLASLNRSQWKPREQLKTEQITHLKTLLHHANTYVPFYRDRYAGLGIDSLDIANPENWRQLPILTRDDIQAATPALISSTIPKGHGSLTRCSTSGSTGKPIQVIQTGLCSLIWHAITLRDHFWHRRDFTMPLVAIRYFPAGTADYPKGLQQQNWGPPAALLYRTGPSNALTIQSSIEQQLEWLQRQRHGYLLTYPTNLAALASECSKANIAFPGMVQIRTVGEVLDAETRESCWRTWRTPVIDVYSTHEAGYIALQCPSHEHYHVQDETIMVEILDEDGNPCDAGEIGRVIITPLHNFAMPLIRYDVGDYAEAGPPCPCGRGLTVLNRIIGRVRNMIRLPTGERYWPIIHHDEIMKAAPIKQFRLIQRTINTIEMDLVIERPLTEAQEHSLRSLIQAHLRFPFEVLLNYRQSIPRNSAGKFEDFMSCL